MGSAMVSPGSDRQSDGNQTPSKTRPGEAAGPDDNVAGLGNAFTGSTDTTNSYWGYRWRSREWERHKENLERWRSEFGWAYREESLLAFTEAEEATEEAKQQKKKAEENQRNTQKNVASKGAVRPMLSLEEKRTWEERRDKGNDEKASRHKATGSQERVFSMTEVVDLQ